MRRVVITGIGLALANCVDRATFWRHLTEGESQLALEPDPSDAREMIAVGRIRDVDPDRVLAEIPERFLSTYPREMVLYLAALLRARKDARIELGELALDRIGLFDGAARPTFNYWYERFTRDHVYTRKDLMLGLAGQQVGVAASLLKIRGPAYTFAGTCSAGAIAVGHAFKEIALGEIDVAFAGGHDSCLSAPLFAMYREAGLLSGEREDPRRAVRPFVGYSTNAFAEGAVILTLESLEHAQRRGAELVAELCGYRYGNNGYHPTAVDVTGLRPTEVIRELLSRTECSHESIDFVVGHGNAVQLSDVSEENYMRSVFGPRAHQVPLISTKPIYGHTLGASNTVNLAAAALMLKEQFVVPTINVDAARQKRAVNHQPNTGVARSLSRGLAVSYGMGGHNTALLLARAEKGSR